jgi:hypothetical protein
MISIENRERPIKRRSSEDLLYPNRGKLVIRSIACATENPITDICLLSAAEPRAPPLRLRDGDPSVHVQAATPFREGFTLDSLSPHMRPNERGFSLTTCATTCNGPNAKTPCGLSKCSDDSSNDERPAPSRLPPLRRRVRVHWLVPPKRSM